MALQSNITVNQVTGTSSLDLYIGAVLVTTYSYSSSAVITLSAVANDSSIDLLELRNNVALVNEWLRLCRQLLLPVQSPAAKYELEVEEGDAQSTFKFKAGNQSKVHLIFNHATKVTTVKARSAITMTPNDCQAYAAALARFVGAPR